MRRRIAALALAGTLALSGCAGTSGYPDQVAEQLQNTVMQVTSSAAAGDLQAALDSLAALEQRTKDAHAAGDISDERYTEITAAIKAVREKLEAQLAAAGGTPAPAPEEDSEGAGTSSAGRGSSPAPEEQGEEPAPAEPSPTPSAAPSKATPSKTPTPKPTGSASTPPADTDEDDGTQPPATPDQGEDSGEQDGGDEGDGAESEEQKPAATDGTAQQSGTASGTAATEG